MSSDDRPPGRVLCLTPNFPRWEGDAVPRYVLHLAADLQDLGWRIDVLAPHAPGAASREKLEGVAVERFRYLWPERAQTLCYGSGTLVNLDRDQHNRRKVPFLIAAQLAAAARRLGSRTYDVLHSHWALPQAVVGALVARPLRVPHVVTCHGEEFHVLRGPWLGPFKRYGLHRADVVTVNSRATEQALRMAAPGVRDVRRIPMGVATDMSPDVHLTKELRSRYRRGEGPLLVFTGRHVEEKGVTDLLRATRLVGERLSDVSVVICGDGRDRATFETTAAELGLRDRVHFPGWVPQRELPSYFAAADVFVAPSRPGRTGFVEGQGLTPLEAMICGTPVIATTFGGYADIIHDERTALAVPEHSPEAIASAIVRLTTEPRLVERLTEEGSRFAAANYSRGSVAAAFSDTFSELAARRRRREPRDRR